MLGEVCAADASALSSPSEMAEESDFEPFRRIFGRILFLVLLWIEGVGKRGEQDDDEGYQQRRNGT